MSQVTLPAKAVLKLALGAIRFPSPQVCKHLVAADMLDALEQHGFPVDEDFRELVRCVINAEDEEAVALFQKLLKREAV